MRQLADARRAKSFAEPDWDAVASCLEYQGISLDSVLPSAKHAWTDFRYGSSLYPLILENGNVLAQYAGTKVEDQFRAAGDICLQAIPDSIRALTVFSLDAIVDGEDNVFFLEMNCNPSLHPDVYLPMFEGLFGPAEPAGTAVEQQLPPAAMPFSFGAEHSPPLRLSAVTRLV